MLGEDEQGSSWMRGMKGEKGGEMLTARSCTEASAVSNPAVSRKWPAGICSADSDPEPDVLGSEVASKKSPSCKQDGSRVDIRR